MFLHTTQCLVSSGTSYALVYGTLRGLYKAGGPVVMYQEVCDHEVPLGMSPVIQATGRRIVHTWVSLETPNVAGIGWLRRLEGMKVDNIKASAPLVTV